jgi:O-antigen ligase
MPKPSAPPRGRPGAPRTLLLLPAAFLMGGWRDPRLSALGGAAVWAAVWLERPALGPAAWWLPWLGWSALAAAAGWQPAAALEPVSRSAAAAGFFSLAASWDERARSLWLKGVVAGVPVLALAAFATGAGRGFVGRMTGLLPPYYNYTMFALAGGVAAAAAWALHPKGARGRWRAAAWSAVALGVAAIVAARSRGALLGLVAAAWFWSARRWGARAAAAGAVVLALAGGAWSLRLVPRRVQDLAAKRYRPYPDLRPQIWRVAELTADENPALGVGPGSFGPAFRRRPIPNDGAARWGFWTEYAHSELLQAAAETGWAGLALWLLGLGGTLLALLGPAPDAPESAAAAAALAALVVQLLIDDMLQLPALAFFFFSAAAVAGARGLGGRRWPRAAALAGAALALASWIPRTWADADAARGVALYPADSDRVEDLAYAAMGARRFDEADALWARAFALAPRDAVYPWRRAEIAAARGRWPEAEALAGQAAALEPGFLRARILRAEAHYRLGRRAEAAAEMAEVRREASTRPEPDIRSGYEVAVWSYDVRELERVAALTGGGRR